MFSVKSHDTNILNSADVLGQLSLHFWASGDSLPTHGMLNPLNTSEQNKERSRVQLSFFLF